MEPILQSKKYDHRLKNSDQKSTKILSENYFFHSLVDKEGLHLNLEVNADKNKTP